MTREQSTLLNLRIMIDDACTAMQYNVPEAAAYKTILASHVIKEFEPAPIDDYDLDKGVVYLAGADEATPVAGLDAEKTLSILRFTLIRAVEALDKEDGWAAGLMMRRAQRICHLALSKAAATR